MEAEAEEKEGQVKPHFLFPPSPLNPWMIDEMFQDQAIALKQAGFGTSVVNVDYERINPQPEPDTVCVYRGWMLNPEEYSHYVSTVVMKAAVPLTSLDQYLMAHHLPYWYPLVEQYTPSTSIFPGDSKLLKSDMKTIGYILGEHVRSMRGLHHLSGQGDGSEWNKFQLKDYVKSLKTAGGSVLTNTEDITPTLVEMEKFRGTIEGGICVRSWEEFFPGSEKRYFVINERAFSPETHFDTRAWTILENVRSLIPSAFWSIDIAERVDGQFRIVEIGDGQVSDLVGWTPERFAEIWK